MLTAGKLKAVILWMLQDMNLCEQQEVSTVSREEQFDKLLELYENRAEK